MKKILILALFISIVSCNGQKHKNETNKKLKENQISKNEKMKKFDIELFNKNQENGEWNFVDDKGNHVRAIKDQNDGYILETTINQDYFNLYEYFHINGNLAQQGKEFHGGGFNKGVWTKYDDIGNKVEEVDYDIPYKNFPWEKVKEYLENKKVNLKDNYTKVWREENEDGIFWMISWDSKTLSERGTQTINNIVIDVKTGKLVKEYTTIYKD